MQKLARNVAHMLSILSKKAPKVFESFENLFGKTGIKHYLDAKGNYKLPEALNIVAKLNENTAPNQVTTSIAKQAPGWMSHINQLTDEFSSNSNPINQTKPYHNLRIRPFGTRESLSSLAVERYSPRVMNAIKAELPAVNDVIALYKFKPNDVRLVTAHIANDPLEKDPVAYKTALNIYNNKVFPLKLALQSNHDPSLETEYQQALQELNTALEPFSKTTYNTARKRSAEEFLIPVIYDLKFPNEVKAYNEDLMQRVIDQERLMNESKLFQTLDDAKYYETVFHPGDNPEFAELFTFAKKGDPHAIPLGLVQKDAQGRYAFHGGKNPLAVYGANSIWASPDIGKAGKYAYGYLPDWYKFADNNAYANVYVLPLSKILSPETWKAILNIAFSASNTLPALLSYATKLLNKEYKSLTSSKYTTKPMAPNLYMWNENAIARYLTRKGYTRLADTIAARHLPPFYFNNLKNSDKSLADTFTSFKELMKVSDIIENFPEPVKKSLMLRMNAKNADKLYDSLLGMATHNPGFWQQKYIDESAKIQRNNLLKKLGIASAGTTATTGSGILANYIRNKFLDNE